MWGPSYGKETNYLRVFMTQIRQKLEPEPSRPRYFVTEPGLGFRFESPEDAEQGRGRWLRSSPSAGPKSATKRPGLATAGVAVLYLVDADDEPPVPTGCLEDWVRIPGEERDLRARLAALELRAELHHSPPFVDDDDRLHHGGSVVALSSIEARLATVLTARLGTAVSDESLLEAVQNGGELSAASLRVEMGRLRSRLRTLHLAIRRTRHGYVLVTAD